jgi:hypothetical protein
MRYLLLLYFDENHWDASPAEEREAAHAAYGQLTGDLAKSGKLGAGDPLQRTRTATTVRVRDGEVLLTDGPYAETKEQLGGYYLIDAEDLDEAISWATRVPAHGNMAVEVRPIMEMTFS